MVCHVNCLVFTKCDKADTKVSISVKIYFDLGAQVILFPSPVHIYTDNYHGRLIALVPHVRIMKLHCYCKHSVLCIGFRARAQIG